MEALDIALKSMKCSAILFLLCQATAQNTTSLRGAATSDLPSDGNEFAASPINTTLPGIAALNGTLSELREAIPKASVTIRPVDANNNPIELLNFLDKAYQGPHLTFVCSSQQPDDLKDWVRHISEDGSGGPLLLPTTDEIGFWEGDSGQGYAHYLESPFTEVLNKMACTMQIKGAKRVTCTFDGHCGGDSTRKCQWHTTINKHDLGYHPDFYLKDNAQWVKDLLSGKPMHRSDQKPVQVHHYAMDFHTDGKSSEYFPIPKDHAELYDPCSKEYYGTCLKWCFNK